jgi:phosphate transport system substrate-binding protein
MRLMHRVITGACALVLGGAGFSSAGYAGKAPTNVYGAGSSLIAPYARQAFDCYGVDANLYFQASPSTSPPTVTNPLAFIYGSTQCTGENPDMAGGVISPPQAPPVTSAAILNYESTGSGTGIKALVAHDATQVGALPSTWPAAPLGVQYAFAETSLNAEDIYIYTNGGGTVSGGICTTPSGTHLGLCVAAPGVAPSAGQVANPAHSYGALIQYPMLVTPVAIAFDPVYEKVLNADSSITEYKFNLKYPRSNNSGGLRIDAATFCQIFNGQIINWNSTALKKLNGNQSLEDPSDPTPAKSWSVPLQIVGRSDSSGTTGLFTRHAASICPGVTYTPPTVNNYTAVTTTLPSALIGATYTKNGGPNPATGEVLGKFTIANGSDGVAQYLGFTNVPTVVGTPLMQGRIGYVGPDYTLPAVSATHATPSVLMTATLENASNQWIAPTSAGALAAFSAQLPPETNINGTYNAASNDCANLSNTSTPSTNCRAAPYDWVQQTSTTSYLANPASSGAYPLTGTSNTLYYTCMANTKETSVIRGFMKWFMTSKEITSTTGLLEESGFAPLPPAWRTAVLQTFIAPVTATSSLDLNISTAGTGAQCTSAGIIGG